jgi:hypothetical protein
MAEKATNATPTDPYVGAIADTRSTAKWLLAGFAAVGAAMIAGLQLTGLGKLAGDELALAVLAVVIAGAGVGIAIYSCADVLTPAPVTLTTLAEDPDVSAGLAGDPILKGFAASGADLKTKYTKALEDYHAAWNAPDARTKGSLANQHALRVQSNLLNLSSVAETAYRYGAWVIVSRTYREARQAIGLAAAMVLFGMLAFAHLANKDAPFSPGSADATATKLVSLSFHADRQASWKPILGDACDLTSVPAVIVGTDSDSGEVELVSLPTRGGCKSKHFKLDRGEGATLGTTDVSVPEDLAEAPR